METFSLFLEDFVLTARFRFQFGVNSRRFAFRLDSFLFRRRFSFDDDSCFFRLCGRFEFGATFRFDASGARGRGEGLRLVFRFFDRRVCLTFARFAQFERFRFLNGELRSRVDDDRLSEVFALDGVGVRVGETNTHVAFCRFDLGVFFERRRLLTDELDAFEVR